jgi:hypothetical protein
MGRLIGTTTQYAYLAGWPGLLISFASPTLRVPRSSRTLRRAGVPTACTTHAHQAADTRKEIFPQPSFTRTAPRSSSR